MAVAHHTPQMAARLERVHAFLLDAYAHEGRVKEAIESLMELQRSEPRRYREIMGRDTVLTFDTIMGYWREIPLDQREAARAEYRSTR